MLAFALTRKAFFSHWFRVRGLFAACAFFICLSGATHAQTFFSGTPKVIDPGIDAAKIGTYTSMAIVDGRPAISYFDETSGDLKFIHAVDPQGTTWGTPVTVDEGTTGTVGQYTSLAEVDGRPAIAYYAVTGTNLKYAHSKTAEGAAADWTILVTIPVTAGNLGQYASLKVVGNNPAISFYDTTLDELKYIRATSMTGDLVGDWALAPFTVDAGTGTTPNVGEYSSLEVVNNKPAISYYDAANGNLNYVRANNATGMPDGSTTPLWGTPVIVESAGTTGSYTSLEVVNGFPAISYYRGGGGVATSNNNLKYARSTNVDGAGGWTIMDVDLTGTVGQHTSLVEANGNPAISYFDATNTNLKYARANIPSPSTTADWSTVTLDSPTSVGSLGTFTSVVIVDGNYPAICYYDATNFDLKFVRATNSTGIDPGNPPPWSTRQAIDRGSGGHVGQHTSMAIVAGNPAVSYYNASEQTLRYIRANEPEGTTWAKPVTIDIGTPLNTTLANVGQYSSLAFVDGRPAIAYYDATNQELKYIRATNSTGIDPNPNNPPPWGPPVTVDTNGNVGQYCSLKVVDGKPAISYYEATTGTQNLRYIRANNSTGIPPPPVGMQTWGPSVLVDDVGNVGLYTSLEVVDGKPAISYYLSTGGSDLKYAQSSSLTGTNAADWTKQAVDLAGNVGQYTSLEVIGGKPAISYYDVTNTNLKYIGGNAPTNPQTWATSITVNGSTPAASVGQYSSLAEVNGKPAISYYSGTGATLRYIRATVANPTVAAQWGTFATLDGTTGTSAPLVGQYTSLAVVACNPAISYYDASSFDLKFVRSKTLWSGALSNDWSNPANWAFGCVPAASESVVLPPSAVTNEAVIDKNVSVGDFTMGATRTLTVTGGSMFTINGVLTMGGGKIVVDPGSLIVFGCSATVVTPSATAFIVGDVKKEFCAPGGFVFPVGELTGTAEYSPLTVNVTAGTFPPTIPVPPSLTVHVTDAPLPGLVAATAVSRYWTVTEAGSLTADMTFEYVPADVNAGTGFKAFRRSGAYAFQVPGSTHTGNTVSVFNITNFSDWGIGAEALPPPLVTVGGQILDINGKYVKLADVTLVEQSTGTVHTFKSTSLGWYYFDDIAVGETVTITVTHKSYTSFLPPMIVYEVTEKTDDLNFTAVP